MLVKSRLVITLIVLLITLIAATAKAQTSQNAQIILNLLNGQQYFGTPHVYQGDYYGAPARPWPVYYGPNNASIYWSQAGISSDQPVLVLVPGSETGGAMFWSETYIGGLVKITIIGTFSSGEPPGQFAHGFEIYLFLNPTKWAVSPNYNYTIPYNSTAGEGWYHSSPSPSYPSPVEGDVILPQSSTPYIVVQWDPYWQSNTAGQWNVWIVSNPSGNNASVTPSPSPNLGFGYAGWGGIGTGAFQPRPGDRMEITITYDPTANVLSGTAYDMNTTQSANFTLNLNGYYTPPTSGNYVFGVGASTGSFSYANWALLYVATTQQTTTPPTPPILPQNYQAVLNLLNGQQYFGAPHVYQGDNGLFQ